MIRQSISRLTVATAFLLAGQVAFGWNPPTVKSNSQVKSTAANCAPPVGATEMSFNSVRALIQTGGDMWWDFSDSQYEVPKGTGSTAIFAGSLWMGGEDVNGQLKLAATRFRQGQDYWTGPLSNGDAEISPERCLEYDKHWTITREEVEDFRDWFACTQDPDCDDAIDFPGYQIPTSILEWPGNGDITNGEDIFLAPFKDVDGDQFYSPSLGDYPWYDIDNEIDCRADRTVTLFGDFTLWWVFNDKGNVHTETGGDPIGMEVRSQAFAFATNDEVNLMTFYNYELVNRSTQTLTNTYFGQWVDADLGGPNDDYVGCDVMRGLGYCYNGDAFDADELGATGYGANPPAIGVDFFEGPYQDNDGIDNAYGIGPGEALNGIGYGDGVVDNERYGMRRFLYHNRSDNPGNPATNDPETAADYYNYLQSIWLDGQKMVYGGNGHPSDPNADISIQADFMFPGETDNLFNWGTQGTSVAGWTEVDAGNAPFDRRFMQSAGPFVLEPGDVNNITVGVVYARATSGDPFESVLALRTADDKAQALFDNCFKVLDGPDAPDVAMQELDRTLILTLSNPKGSNNYLEGYQQIDPFIPELEVSSTPIYTLDTATGQYDLSTQIDTNYFDRVYRFQGYQIFQLADGAVTPSELTDVDRARLVFQCDRKDSVENLINFEFDLDLGASVPQMMVEGDNDGIRHSYKITEDLFAEGDRRLINHKTYYYMAIAYSYNNYKTYDPQNPDALDGQTKPYLASRKAASGSIKIYSGIPHIPTPELNGTIVNSAYGDGPQITRMEGQGNGALALDLTEASENEILSAGFMNTPTYKNGAGPIDVKVVDPLSVPDKRLELRLLRDTIDDELDEGTWVLTNLDDASETWESERTIAVGNEQMIPELGMSVTIEQHLYEVSGLNRFTPLLEANIIYTDSAKAWLGGVEDADGFSPANWIRSGTSTFDAPNDIYNDFVGIDDLQEYEGILNGTWAPFRLVTDGQYGPISTSVTSAQGLSKISDLYSVDIVITDDQSKWTRCPVVEMQEEAVLSVGNVDKMDLRADASVDLNGNPETGSTGMGWFPGYAINLETGERLNMAFGENSWLKGENGDDMLWNPTDRYASTGLPLYGGQHTVYVFRNDAKPTGDDDRMPDYDQGAFMYEKLQSASSTERRKAWRACMYVGYPMLENDAEFLSTQARIRIRVAKTYEDYDTGTNDNNTDPLYQFSTSDLAVTTADNTSAVEALDIITAVPNPYYAYSRYEVNSLDNRIKIANLPDQCTVSIYTVDGTLVRQFQKDNQVTSIDWDLKNSANIPIAGGVYIIHVDAPGIGEKVIKWFGMLRPVSLDNF